MAPPVAKHDLVHYLEVLRRRKWWVLVPAMVIAAVTVPIVMSLPPAYRSTTLIMVEAQKVPEAFVRTTVTTPIEDRLRAISQQILSRTRLERVIEKYSLYRETEKTGWWGAIHGLFDAEEPEGQEGTIMLDLVERLKSSIDIQVPRGRNPGATISISYSGEDPRTVMEVTNELASLFIEENLRVREAQAEGTTEFLENELNQAKGQLETQEEQLRSFKQRSMGELPGQLDTNLRTLDRLQSESHALQQRLKAAEDRYGDLTLGPTALAPSGDGARSPSGLAMRLQTMRSRLADLRSEYRDEYPDVVSLRKEIARAEAELIAQEKAAAAAASASAEEPPDPDRFVAGLVEQQRELRAIKQRQQAIQEQIREYEKRVENTPVREQQLAMIMRDYENVKRNYQSLLEKRQEAKIAESLERRQKAEIFRILDPADLPARPYKPNRPLLILIGMVGGLVGGLGLALFREQLDPSIRSEADLVAATTGLPLLAVVPVVPARRKKTGRLTAFAVPGKKTSR